MIECTGIGSLDVITKKKHINLKKTYLLDKSRDSMSLLEALPGKFDVKNTHLVFSITTMAILYNIQV